MTDWDQMTGAPALPFVSRQEHGWSGNKPRIYWGGVRWFVQARGRPNMTDPELFGKALEWAWAQYEGK